MWNNSFCNHESVLAIKPKVDFGTFEFVRHRDSCVLPSFPEMNEACKDLLELHLTGCTLTPEGLKAFKETVRCCSILHSFSYGSILMKTTNLKIIINTLQHCKMLCNLSLTNIELYVGNAEELADFLKSISLFKLDLNHSHIDGGVAQVLSRALESSTVCSLKLSSCYIGDIAIAAISKSIQFSLHELDISYNGIQCQGAQALADGLKQCSSLAVLDISHNHIRGNGACALADALVNCTNLTKLSICHNCIDSIGIKALVNALKYWTELKQLDLNDNRLIYGIPNYYEIMRKVEIWKKDFPTCDIML